MGSYLGPLVAVVEIICGLSFLTNKYTALAAILAAPVMLNVFLYHATLDPGAIAGAAVGLLFTIIVLYSNKTKYASMLTT